jgi:hypothetical protein
MPGVGAGVGRASTKHSDAGRMSGARLVWFGWIPARAATSRPARHLSRGASAIQARPKSVSCAAYPMPRHYRAQSVALRPSRSVRGANPKAAPASRAFLAPTCEGAVREQRLGLSDAVNPAGTGPPTAPICPQRCSLRTTAAPRLGPGRAPPGAGWAHAEPASLRNATWLILPVVICLSQRLSHACVSMNKFRL